MAGESEIGRYSETILEAPVWPYPEVVQLRVHPNGQWYKRVNKHTYYFGPLSDPEQALRDWRWRWPGILAGRDPKLDGPAKPTASELIVGDLCDAWLAARELDVQSGDLEPVTFKKYKAQAQKIVDLVGFRVPVCSMTNETFRKLKLDIAKDYTSPDRVSRTTCPPTSSSRHERATGQQVLAGSSQPHRAAWA